MRHGYRRRIILTALFALGTACRVSGQEILQRTEVCADPNGFVIELLSVYLPEEHFNEPDLRSYFGRLPLGRGSSELWVTASCDIEFLNALRKGSVPAAELGLIKVPFETSKPLAYFFRLGDNAFFQYRDASGAVSWVVLQGENVFQRKVFDSAVVRFAGFKFGRGVNDPCSKVGRQLWFVLPEIGQVDPQEVLELSRSYGRLFPYPEFLDVNFEQSFGWAGATGRFLLPALSGNLAQPRSSSEETSTLFSRGRNKSYRFLLYRAGKLVFSTEGQAE